MTCCPLFIKTFQNRTKYKGYEDLLLLDYKAKSLCNITPIAHPLNLKRTQEWIDLHSKEDKYAACRFASFIKHVPWKEVKSNLFKATNDALDSLKNQPYTLLIGSEEGTDVKHSITIGGPVLRRRKSNFWTASIIYNEVLQTKPPAFVSTSIKEQISKNGMVTKNYLLIDDAIFSGGQMSTLITSNLVQAFSQPISEFYYGEKSEVEYVKKVFSIFPEWKTELNEFILLDPDMSEFSLKIDQMASQFFVFNIVAYGSTEKGRERITLDYPVPENIHIFSANNITNFNQKLESKAQPENLLFTPCNTDGSSISKEDIKNWTELFKPHFNPNLPALWFDHGIPDFISNNFYVLNNGPITKKVKEGFVIENHPILSGCEKSQKMWSSCFDSFGTEFTNNSCYRKIYNEGLKDILGVNEYLE